MSPTIPAITPVALLGAAAPFAQSGLDLAQTDLAQWLPILIFLGIAVLLSAGFVFAPIVASRFTGAHRPGDEKLSEYECGFPAFEAPRRAFDVRFYLVAILFIIFDLEVAFLFPWAVTVFDLGWQAWGGMIVFLTVLTVGFLYEWKKGALEWE
ncbi:NAD(P)H-quinone oxidoreductase subunit 3 [Altererythrobacter xixiisoli]|uniref:NADH-quinone oxidoreductase subunit A n=1 Tax=Croceibacterium xixiisoli TaxID=1476466 RepID=A0A6I4TTC9_9SPHN|nr:NADH-quinone oxidoreductase subunit A [Croceibacterium xixiisoli]MXO99425.1 NAD(P)H-quinone oxidoreductase subunit 3 [Croceibacterium xixiisoli]